MKKYIKCGTAPELLSTKYFTLDIWDAPFERLSVKESDKAKKYAIKIILESSSEVDNEGRLERCLYDPSAFIRIYHEYYAGIETEPLENTYEYSLVLQDAVEFAYKLCDWLQAHPEWISEGDENHRKKFGHKKRFSFYD